jgi:predicted RNA-binding protein (virulence factor B family)
MSVPVFEPELAIGRRNRLKVLRHRDIGLFLDGGEFGSILLPKRYAPADAEPGQLLDVFVYLDSEDQLIATTEQPLIEVGQCACLRVVSIGSVGAFLDWGLPKDLLLPFGQQQQRVEEGKRYLVYAYLDNSNRIAASTKLNRFIDHQGEDYRVHQPVELLIAERTELGVKAVVDHRHWGLLHHADLFKPVRYGQRLTGYIKRVRSDGKLDLVLERAGYAPVSGLTEQILEQLQAQGGFLPFTDRSDPGLIKQQFGVSKKKFKMALGALYKARKISLDDTGIRLIS